MRTERQLTVGYDKGIHTRVAAMIVQKSTELEERFGCRLYIKRVKKALIVPTNSVLPLVGMKLKEGEAIALIGDGVKSEEAVAALVDFIGGSGAVDQDEVDNIIQKNTLTSEKIFESIENGLIVVDAGGRITIFNHASSRMTGISGDSAIGRRADDLIGGFGMAKILENGRERLGIKQKLGDSQVIVDKSPVVVDGSIVGAVAVLQDISQIEALSWELSSVRELEGKLISILEAVYDGICLIDTKKCITYVNAAFAGILKRKPAELTEQPIGILFPGEKIPESFFDHQKETIITNDDGREFMLDSRPMPWMIK